MNDELKKFIKECDCPEIQKTRQGKRYCPIHCYLLNFNEASYPEYFNDSDKSYTKEVFCPTLQQMIDGIGKKFIALSQFKHSASDPVLFWRCDIEEADKWKKFSTVTKSPRLALILAWKGILSVK